MANRVGNISSLINSLSGLAPIFAGSGKTTSTQQNLDPGSIASLQKLLSGGGFSKGAAQADSKLAIDAIVRKILEAGTPSIGGVQKGTGLYNDTTSALLSNDLIAKAAQQGALVGQQTIKDYAAIQSQAAQNLKGATVTKTSQTGPAIEDPLMAALKTAGIGLGVSLGSKALGGITDALFGGSKKKKRIGEEEDFSDVGGFNAVDTAQFTPSFSTDVAVGGDFNTLGAADSLNLPDIGSNVASAGAGGLDLTGAAGSLIGAVASPLIEALGGSINSDGQGGFTGGFDCFITTAVCAESGLPDNCEELTMLREFRDTYMKSTPAMAAKVAQYYKEAPEIVKLLEAKSPERKTAIYKVFLDSYITPAINFIRVGDLDSAYEVYADLFHLAKSISEG